MNKHILWTRHLVLAGIFAVSCLSVVNCSHQSVEPDGRMTDDVPPPDFVDYDIPPRIVRITIPVYPEIARKAGLEGTVWVKMWVDKQGKVRKAVIQRSASEIFDQPCLDAAMQFLFTPAMKNDRPVEVWVVIPFEFRLSGDVTSLNASSTSPGTGAVASIPPR